MSLYIYKYRAYTPPMTNLKNNKYHHRVNVISESKRIFKLGIPLIISQIALIGMSVTDTLMAGRYGTEDLAAIAVATGLWYPGLVLLLGILSGASPLMSQAFGAENWSRLGRKLLQALWLSVISGIITFALILMALPYLDLLDSPQSVQTISNGYLTAIAFGAPGLAIATVFRSYCEANGNTKTPMIINIAAFLLNILLDYVLVFGHGDVPAMGGVGCGYATAIIYWFTALILAMHVVKAKRYKKALDTIIFTGPKAEVQKEIIRIGLPSSIGVCAEVTFFALVAILLIPFGSDIVAAHQIALNVSSVIFMVPLGMSMAIAIRVGHLLGQEDYDYARFSAFLTIGITCSLAVITAILTVIFRDRIVGLYTHDPLVFNTAYGLLLFSAIFQFIDAIQIVSVGALRGYKDTRVPMIIQIFSYWCVGFVVSWSLSIGNLTGESWQASGFWMGFVAGLSAAGILLLARLNKVSRKHCLQ